MKLIRRAIVVVALLTLIFCVLLLLNITAPNPTGRRYSSNPVPFDGLSYDKGKTAEAVLAIDLGLPANDFPGGPHNCICNIDHTLTPGRCQECLIYLPLEATFRIPDFIGPNFIVDSKNRKDYGQVIGAQATQLQDYANAAATLNYSFWVYVPSSVMPNPTYIAIAQSTGGNVVPYFVDESYRDDVDQAATVGVVVSVVIAGGLIALEVRLLWRFRRRPKSPPPKPRPRRYDVLSRAIQAVEDADEFRKRSKESGRRRAEIEDARE